MVTGSYLKCDICDAVFKFRLQADNSMYSYDLPIGIKCPNCGNTFDCHFNYKMGIMPKQYYTSNENVADYSIAYSPQLPIPLAQYYQEKETIGLTPYLELSGYYDMRGIYAFGKYMQLLLDEFFPQRELFSKCLPILKKGNVKAFQKMMQKIRSIKYPTNSLQSLSECFSVNHDFYISAWNIFAVKSYRDHVGNVFQKMMESVRTMPIDQLKSLYEQLSSVRSLLKWRWDAWEDFGRYALHIERYFPAMFHLYLGDFNLPHSPALCIVTISQTISNNNYAGAYARFSQVLPFLVALLNWKITGDYDRFPNANTGMKGITGISNFASIAEGLQLEKLSDYNDMHTYLMGCMDNHMRNAIDHRHVDMDPISQEMKYYYRPGDNSLFSTGTLIDECYRTHICMLHIVEAVLIVDELKNRLQ